MRDDYGFSPSSVYGDNFSALDGKLSALTEMRISEIAALARETSEIALGMLNDGFSQYEALSALSVGEVFEKSDKLPDALPRNRELISKALLSATASDKAIFADLYSEWCERRKAAFTISDFFEHADIPETFTYVKNALADEAYAVFSEDFEDPRVFYAAGIKEAVLSVVQQRIGYALLPLEESGGVRLGGIESIIRENDLKIAALTPVFGFEGNVDMKYALVCRTLSLPSIAERDEAYVELRLAVNSEPTLSELLVAADTLSFSPYKVRTTSYIGRDGEATDFYSVILKDEKKKLVSLFVYLNLFYPDCDVVGIYKNME